MGNEYGQRKLQQQQQRQRRRRSIHGYNDSKRQRTHQLCSQCRNSHTWRRRAAVEKLVDTDDELVDTPTDVTVELHLGHRSLSAVYTHRRRTTTTRVCLLVPSDAMISLINAAMIIHPPLPPAYVPLAIINPITLAINAIIYTPVAFINILQYFSSSFYSDYDKIPCAAALMCSSKINLQPTYGRPQAHGRFLEGTVVNDGIQLTNALR